MLDVKHKIMIGITPCFKSAAIGGTIILHFTFCILH